MLLARVSIVTERLVIIECLLVFPGVETMAKAYSSHRGSNKKASLQNVERGHKECLLVKRTQCFLSRSNTPAYLYSVERVKIRTLMKYGKRLLD